MRPDHQERVARYYNKIVIDRNYGDLYRELRARTADAAHEGGEIMAGATLALRRLAQRDNLSSMLLGYAHAGLITSGPWMMTVIAVAAISLMGRDLANVHEMAAFRSILIYNFAFSLVISGPILLVATRLLANSPYTGASRWAAASWCPPWHWSTQPERSRPSPSMDWRRTWHPP